MKIGPDHILFSTAPGEIIKKDLLPGGSDMPTRRLLVIHFTAGMSAASSISWWRDPAAKGASAHIIIDRDGTIIQCRPFNRTAGHAGKSKWHNPSTGQVRENCNAFSIGIELANAGDSVSGTVENPKAFKKYPLPAGALKAKHKKGGPETLWEKYPQAQLDACFALSKALVERYRLDDLVGHEDIAPERKNDPGPAFPMNDLRKACNFEAMPV